MIVYANQYRRLPTVISDADLLGERKGRHNGDPTTEWTSVYATTGTPATTNSTGQWSMKKHTYYYDISNGTVYVY